MFEYEEEVINYLKIPSLPKKVWDGNSSFKDGVAIVTFTDGTRGCVIASFDAESDKKPRIRKVFSIKQFVSVETIYVVPNYMDRNVEDMDLDDESKKRASEILKEAEELENEGLRIENPMASLPEWVFPEITNKEEAEAWLRRYNSINHVKGKIPKNEETIKLRLYAIYSERSKLKK